MARKIQLLGPDGEPVQRRVLTREVAAPELAGVRTLWQDAIAPGLTPQRLAAILRDSENGNHRDYLTLAEEMEERELHYNAVLSTRKRALSSIEPIVEAGGEDARSAEIADAVQDLVDLPVFASMIEHLTDALGKSYAVSEIMWETSASQWMPYDYRDRDPRFFTFELVDRHIMRLASLTDPINGDPMPPFKFIRHVPKLKSGIPVRGGLAKPAAWAFVFKSYTLKDWVAFAEVYGMPIRVGKYGPKATQEDRSRLLDAVRNIGSDAAGIIPDTMAIEFVEAGKSASEKVFSGLADYLDKQVSKLVLGQTMTTDHGSSMAQAKVHENVRHDIKIDDARKLETTINRDLIRAFVDLNYGPQKSYPYVRLPVPAPEDLSALATNLTMLVPLGLRVSEQDVRERFGFTEPEAGAAVLMAAPGSAVDVDPETGEVTVDEKAEDDPAEEKPAKKRASKRGKRKPVKAKNRQIRSAPRAKICAACGVAHNAAEHDTLDGLTESALGDWKRVADPLLKPIRDLVNSVGSYDELLAGLPKAMSRMDAGKLVETLAASMAISRGLGEAKP